MQPNKKTQEFSEVNDMYLGKLTSKLEEIQTKRKELETEEKAVKTQLLKIMQDQYKVNDFQKTSIEMTNGLAVSVSFSKPREVKNYEVTLNNNFVNFVNAQTKLLNEKGINLNDYMVFETQPVVKIGNPSQLLLIKRVK